MSDIVLTAVRSPRPSTGLRRLVSRAVQALGLAVVAWLVTVLPPSVVASPSGATRPAVHIPRIDGAPGLEDFSPMGPSTPLARSMARVDGFRQERPRDGDPVSQRTEAYLGYDESRLYVVFVCFDSEPGQIRARQSRREDTRGDDGVGVFLDTFDDQLRAYAFTVNPLGIQRDGSWVEREGDRYNQSFDTVWDSGGALTPEGYVAWMAIPFRSLRFSPKEGQDWGILLRRDIRRSNESAWWPYVTSRVEGRLNQDGALRGITDVSPGRNLQLIPYGFFRSFRALDSSDEDAPRYVSDSGELDGGVDFKTVFRDSLVLDLTANPDFNQIESDQPQVTVNQRFEVFFPERRPFFLENASYFETPINLFFSRRIVDPQLGVRLTGKAGPFAVGALFANDRAPDLDVPPDDPLFGEKSQNAVLRVSRDLPNQSSIGAIYTDSRLDDAHNQVGGLDARWRLSPNWIGTFQGVASRTRFTDGEEQSGPAFDAVVQRSGRKLEYQIAYNDRSPGFFTTLGFLPGSRGPSRPGRPRTRALLLRPDFRGLRQTLNYRFRPEGDVLISWGPDITFHPSWRHDGSALDTLYSLDMTAELMGRTFVGAFYTGLVERLRPSEDFPALPEETRYDSARTGLFWSSSLSRFVTLSGEYAWGTVINLVAPEDVPPPLADSTQANFDFRWFITRSVRLEGTYLLSRVTESGTSRRVFTNHIGRARLSWQPTQRISLRTIVQYNFIEADPELSTLETEENLNLDFLATYLVNPWTAVYVGYNNNQNSFRLVGDGRTSELVPGHRLGPDSWQFFVKISYLVQF